MEKIMADNHAAMAARDEKRRLKKEAVAAICPFWTPLCAVTCAKCDDLVSALNLRL
jgi:hypothetical protein